MLDHESKYLNERFIIDHPLIKVRASCNAVHHDPAVICMHAVDFGQGWRIYSRPVINKVLTELGIAVPPHFCV